MSYLSMDSIFSLKNYIDKRELRIKQLSADEDHEKKYGFFTFESFEPVPIKEIIDKEFMKFEIKKQNGLELLIIKISPYESVTLSAPSMGGLKREFIRYLINY